MEAEHYYPLDHSNQPAYHELRSRIHQLELSVAQLLDYPPVVPLRMRHVITTPSRFNPYPFQCSHTSQYSSSPSPINSPISSNYTQHSSPAVSPTKHQPQYPLADVTNSSDDRVPTNPSDDKVPTNPSDDKVPTNPSDDKVPTNPVDDKVAGKKSLLDTLLDNKKANPLPQINKESLLKPEDVVEKYSQFLTFSKIPTLAVRLAKESYFGKSIMARCTVRGAGKFHALPEKELKDMKFFLMKICVPRYTSSHTEFEVLWKNCTEAIGQACKSMRRQGEP